LREATGYACPDCGDLLQIRYDPKLVKDEFRSSLDRGGVLSVWRYRGLLPISSKDVVTIGEGGTGLPRSSRLSQELSLRELYFKNEGQNPTGSFKDRGMTVAITRAVEMGVKSVICASTGNTSASMAAYAAKAGMKAIVLIPKGKIAKGKLLQARIHGASIVEVKGNFDRALKTAKHMAEKRKDLYLVNSVNPYRIEGQKTTAFEIWEQLARRVPDYVLVPVGNAGNISAIWKGFKEMQELELIERTPKMIGVQASGAAPIANAYTRGIEDFTPWPHPSTIATAIRIGAPASWKKALTAVRESNGTILKVSDKEIIHAQRLLARREGIFAEPASAASLAGVYMARNSNLLKSDACVVCVITGHGLKDQQAAAFRRQ
jgi:threonine synthase